MRTGLSTLLLVLALLAAGCDEGETERPPSSPDVCVGVSESAMNADGSLETFSQPAVLMVSLTPNLPLVGSLAVSVEGDGVVTATSPSVFFSTATIELAERRPARLIVTGIAQVTFDNVVCPVRSRFQFDIAADDSVDWMPL